MPSRPSHHPLAVEFGARVKGQRALRRLSRDQLGELTGFSEKRIGAIERGDYMTDLRTVVLLEGALQCGWDALLAGLIEHS